MPAAINISTLNISALSSHQSVQLVDSRPRNLLYWLFMHSAHHHHHRHLWRPAAI